MSTQYKRMCDFMKSHKQSGDDNMYQAIFRLVVPFLIEPFPASKKGRLFIKEFYLYFIMYIVSIVSGSGSGSGSFRNT